MNTAAIAADTPPSSSPPLVAFFVALRFVFRAYIVMRVSCTVRLCSGRCGGGGGGGGGEEVPGKKTNTTS
jgi:hypothetical protein